MSGGRGQGKLWLGLPCGSEWVLGVDEESPLGLWGDRWVLVGRGRRRERVMVRVLGILWV